MKLFETKTKRNLVHMIVYTSIFFVAFEIAFLSKYYPESTYEAGFLFAIFAFFGVMGCLYYYGKAKKEDKLAEGL